MAFIPVPSCAQFNLKGFNSTANWENTLYFARAASWTLAELQLTADALAAWWNVNMAPQLNVAVTLNEVVGRSLETQFGLVHTKGITPAHQGDITGNGMSPHDALCVSFRTGVAGRSFRGRNYVTGLSESNCNGGVLDQGVTDAIVTAYEELLSTLVTGGGVWVVVSRFSNGAPRNPGIRTAISSVLAVDNVIDTQRRRKP